MKSDKIFTVLSKIPSDSDIKKLVPNKSLHKCLKWLLVIAQLFGQMPVSGITKEKPCSLRFQWMSWRTIYCLYNLCANSVILGFYLFIILTGNVMIYQYNTFIFHINSCAVILCFLGLAQKWPRIMKKWSGIECAMRSYGWPDHLHTRITVIYVTVLLVAAIETGMSKASKFVETATCLQQGEDYWERYFETQVYAEMFDVVPFAMFKGVFVFSTNILATFSWWFNDLFIMLMSTAIAVRFRQVTMRLQILQQNCKYFTQYFLKSREAAMWREIREDYNRLSQLTKYIDEALSYMIVVSFSNNLISILMQFFNSIRKMKNMLEKIYFFFSFASLLIRTICVSFYGGWIHDESRKPLTILNSITSEVYNNEIKRFIQQLKFDPIALTGNNFFSVTRSLILSMAGAIITYELVLIQFNQGVLEESAQAANTSGSC